MLMKETPALFDKKRKGRVTEVPNLKHQEPELEAEFRQSSENLMVTKRCKKVVRRELAFVKGEVTTSRV